MTEEEMVAKTTPGSEPKGAAEGGDGDVPPGEAGAEKSGGTGRHRTRGGRLGLGALGAGGRRGPPSACAVLCATL